MKKALFALFFLVSAAAWAKPSGGGLLINVSCPDTSFAPAASITCTFTVQNRNLAAAVDTLALTDTFGGNSPAATLCYTTPALSVATDTLAARGQTGDTCYGSTTNTVPVCTDSNLRQDKIDGTAEDFTFGTVSGSGFDGYVYDVCTPTPSPTPTTTPTSTPTPSWLDLQVTKTCPSPVTAGATFDCTFTVTNPNATAANISSSGSNGVFNFEDLAGLYIGGLVTGPWPCKIGATTITSLAPGATCGGTVTETAPACNVVLDETYQDRLEVYATGHPRAFSNIVSVTILACTPTPTPGGPTNTPTVTPTNTPTGTPPTATSTPTVTPTPTRTPTNVITPSTPTTPTNTPTITPTPTVTRTATQVPSPTPTRTPCQDPTILTGTIRVTGGMSGASAPSGGGMASPTPLPTIVAEPHGVNGRVIFTLSRPAVTLAGACSFWGTPFQVPARQVSFKLVDGSIPVTNAISGGVDTGYAILPVILGNDCLTPSTYYKMAVVDGTTHGVILRRNVTIKCDQNDIGNLPDAVLP